MRSPIIDSHTHIIPHREPVWGWGPHFTVEQLIGAMDHGYDVMGEIRHVDKAIVMTGLGLTSVGHRTIEAAHKYAIDSVGRFPERLYLNAVINPRAWKDDQLDILSEWKAKSNLVMLKLHPSMHNYYLPQYIPWLASESQKLIYPVFDFARSLDVPVMIHMGESPYSIPAQIASIAEAYPDVAIVVAHSGANNIPAMPHDGILLARTHDNIYLGTSWVEAWELQQMYHAIGASKIIFESDCAPRSIGTTLRLTTNLHLAPPLGTRASEEEVYKMIGGNIAALCHIPAT
jgi:predicted TIM-barrel fold metal-dependent hydrolase